MPHKDVLSIFTQRGPLAIEKWYEILEARKTFMMDHIDDLGQMKLGNIPIWNNPGDISGTVSKGLVEAHLASPNKKQFNMDTRGVFVFDKQTFRPISNHSNQMAVYGFTRSGKWLIATIVSSDHEIYQSEEPVKTVRLESSDPNQWVTISPYRIFALLGAVVKKHAERREALWQQALEMSFQFKMEDRLVLTWQYDR